MKTNKTAAVVLCLGILVVAKFFATTACLASEGFLQALESRAFSFPEDHADHPGFQTEWWYYTGNLITKDGKKPFGFQLTFFRVQLKPTPVVTASSWRTNQIFFAHLAMSDLQNGRFLTAEKMGRGAMGIGGVSLEAGRVRVFLHGWQTAIDGRTHRLQADSDEFGINLELLSEKPPVLHGERGLSRKGSGSGQASYYYSLTHLKCLGSISLGKDSFEVSGLGWMDHEFSSNVLSEYQVGWDWMGLQLSDGRELMLYVLRHRDGSVDPFSSGTLVEKDGTWVHLPKQAFVMEPADYWHSTRSKARYPSSWRVQVLPYHLSLRVIADLKDQELITGQSTQVTYWEGSVRATGTVSAQKVTGRGYVEMTGYAGAFSPAFRAF